MRGSIIALCALALAVGCHSSGEDTSKARVEQYAAELGTSSASASASTAGGAKSVAEANDVWDFAYSYPAAVGRIAPLREMLDARQAKALADLKEQAIDGRSIADQGGYPYNPYLLHVEWKVVADLPRWLSLSAEVGSYEGGAHPNYGFDALLWDKQANRSVEPDSLFASPVLNAAVKEALCASLNRQREERRGEPVDPSSQDMYDQCPGLDEMTVILGSSNRRTFDRIGFLIDPYVAGPYAEGSFEVTLPVTGAVMRAVKPPYRASFTVTG